MNTSINVSVSLRLPRKGVSLLIILILSIFVFTKAEAQIAVVNRLSDSGNDGLFIIKGSGNSDASTTPFFYSEIDDSKIAGDNLSNKGYTSNFIPYSAAVPVTVIDFNGEGWSTSQNLGPTLTRSDFVFSLFDGSLAPQAIKAGKFGEGNSLNLFLTQTHFVIKKTDGSEFDLESMFVIGDLDQTFSIVGYRNTKSVVTTSVATTYRGVKVYPSTLAGGFANVDSVVVSNTGFGGLAGGLDTFTFAPPTDLAPPDVKKILVAGSPLGSATSINYTVSFYENTNNLSTDDFQLTTTGTAAGTISAISASSGTSVNVTVNSISGEGTLRLDLKSNTNITDDLGNGNNNNGYADAFTGGITHTTDFTAPTGYTANIDQAYINDSNKSNVTFTFSGAEVGGSYSYSYESSGGGSVGSSGNVTSASQTISVPCSSCVGDGTVTFKFTHKDAANNSGSTITKTVTKDTVLPAFENSTPSSSNIGETTFDLSLDMNEAGKLYYVVVADAATAPTAADVKAGNANGGGTPVTGGNASVTTGGFSNTFNVTGLSIVTAYYVYAIAEDVAGNLVNGVSKIDVATVDLNDPVFTSATTANFSENGTGTAYTVVATDANTITYSLGNAKDEALFNIVGATGVVTFKNAPDFENPTDGNTDNAYVINVIANDGTNSVNQDVTITVTNVNEDPSITSTAITAVNDNETYSYKIATSDLDNDAVTVSATTKPDWLTLKLIENEVSTLAGAGNYASVDGTGTSASFYLPDDIVLDASGNLYVSDFGSHKIRKVTPDGVVSTLAGSGEMGNTNGNGENASFKYPRGLAIDAAGNVFVADRNNNVIRKITPSGDVTTYAGSGTWGSTNGTSGNARFNSPNGVAVDASGNLFVTDGNNNLIRKIDTNGNVSSFASVANPFGIAIDAAGILYVTERDNNLVRKITPNGVVTTLAGTGVSGSADGPGLSASFNYPSGITVDAAGNVYVADKSNHKIRKIAPDGEVTTVAFVADATGITVDASGVMYASTARNIIEKISSYYLLSGSAEGHAGKHNVTLSAIDGDGATASQSFVVDVSRVLTPDANNILYVNKNVSGGNGRGGSWANAAVELADALVWAKENYDNAWATEPLQIWVAGGTYKPLYSPEDGDNFARGTDPRDNAFLLVNNVELYGGFAGTETALTDRDLSLTANATTLSGDFNDDDVVTGTGSTLSFTGNTENAYHVIISAGPVGKARVDGFTVTNANANGTGNITVNTISFIRNYGGGMFIDASSPTIHQNTFVHNYSSDYGSGIFNDHSSAPKVSNSIFKDNKVGSCGGAMYNYNSSNPTITNSLFTGNSADDYGGAIYNSANSSSTIINSTIVGNSAASDGEGIYIHTSTATIQNSIVWNEISTYNGGTYTIENSVPQGSSDDSDGNIDATSLTASDLFTDQAIGDYSLKHTSPAVNAGKNALYIGTLATDTDLAGRLRLFDGAPATDIIDIGAYEYHDIVDPVLTSGTTVNFVENGTGTAYTVVATDANAITYGLGTGNDEGLFNIVGATGVVTFKNSPDFENPADGDANNTYVINVIASDGVNSVNQNVTITVTDADEIKPTVTVTSSSTSPTSGAFDVTITFSESVTGFVIGDLAIGNGTASNFAGTGTTYTATVTPSADGAVTVNVAAGVAQDAAANTNTAATQFSITNDETKPTVTITSSSTSPTSGAFDVTITFSESVIGFVIGDLTIGNGTASNFAGTGTTYTATVTPSADGAVTVNVAAGVAQDAAANTNTVAAQLSITNDQTKPSTVISSASNSPTSGAFDVTITFSESVTGFVIGDLMIGNGTASNFAGTGTTYTATVTPSADGVVTVNVAAGVAQDAAANTNKVAAQLIVTNDETKPSVIIIASTTNPVAGAYLITAQFSEGVIGLGMSDIKVVDGSASDLIAVDADTYTFSVTSSNSSVAVNIEAGAVIDVVGNWNTASNVLNLVFNLAPTNLTLSASAISENNTIGQLIGYLSTIDADPADTHTYSLVSGTGDTDNASFTIVGNKLQAAAIFDFEVKTSYTIRLKTDDGRGGTFEKQFTISVTNIEEPEVRIESDFEIPATALGLTTNFDITIHNDGDATLMVNSVLYPDGFTGFVTGLVLNPGESRVMTLGFKPTEVKIYSGIISFITNAGTASVSVSGQGAIITGVDDGFIDAEEINLFPNPAQDILNIDLSKLGNKKLDISIVNASGTPIFNTNGFTEKTLRLDVSGYTSGLYIVQFTDGISVVRKKVMIKR